jgi:hypothetical protein
MPTYHTEKTILTYVVLHEASWSSLKQAKDAEGGRFYNCMAAMVFSAFAMEAYLNHVGPIYVAELWKKERSLGHDGRLKAIADAAKFTLDFSCRPFSTLPALFKFRDTLAHARTEHLAQEEVVETFGETPDLPEAEWEREVSLANAQMYHDDTEQMIRTLHFQLALKDDPFFTGWLGKWHTKP